MPDLVEELTWRGMIADSTPGLEEALKSGPVTGYIGFDPTSDSLHIGNLASLMLLVHLQQAGHQPIALIGGATGMVGDPSGKSQERNLLDEHVLRQNEAGIKSQLAKFLTFKGENAARLVNNYDWYQHFTLLNFLRDVGKNLTVNYMMAKDSVKTRLESGLSFTEFSYQLLQGYDFYYLYKNQNCTLQMGGSDQWGNMTAGMEFIRRMDGGSAHVLTCPLITKADGTKFGKSEEGNIWLDANKTSPYTFYQFWLNVADEDVGKLIRVFTFIPRETIEDLEVKHQEAPHQRLLQKTLADEVTKMVHGEVALEEAQQASEILFGKVKAQNLMEFGPGVFQTLSEIVPPRVHSTKCPTGQ